MLQDTSTLKQIVEDMLKEARLRGASGAEAGVSAESGLSVTVRLGEVETVEHNRDKGLGVTVYFGQRKGSASTTDFSPQAIRDTVQAACDIARYTAEDPYSGLVEARYLATSIPDLELHHPWTLGMDKAIELARACEESARSYDKRITNSEGAYVASHEGERVYGNSNGFLGAYASTRHSLGCTVIGQSGEAMQRDHWYSVARNPAQLEDVHAVGEAAARRTVQRLDARRINTCEVPVLFEADVARGLLGHLVRAVSGGSLYRRASFLLDKKGEQIFPARVRIDERPHLKGALGSSPFDNEGVTTRPRDLVSEGVLQGYVLDAYSARKLGMETTGNAGGVHNLHINHDDLSQDDLIRQMKRGVLVTEVMGQGVNTVTGDYSRGAAGFWIENGEIAYPVEEFTLAGNLSRMFMGLQAVGNDLDRRGNLVTGSWLIERMTLAGSND